MKSCEKASTLTSAALDRNLTFAEKIGLLIHRSICAPCRIYRRQLDALQRASKSLNTEFVEEQPMADDARARIRQRLRDAQKPKSL